ncbi:MAG: hypothetical protein K0S74_415 [Chlamydiales bacterium]|jgi:inorganic triphosphatase YgiF|nr:hypothetical protein [Chlamydiales bacterium]
MTSTITTSLGQFDLHWNRIEDLDAAKELVICAGQQEYNNAPIEWRNSHDQKAAEDKLNAWYDRTVKTLKSFLSLPLENRPACWLTAQKMDEKSSPIIACTVLEYEKEKSILEVAEWFFDQDKVPSHDEFHEQFFERIINYYPKSALVNIEVRKINQAKSQFLLRAGFVKSNFQSDEIRSMPEERGDWQGYTHFHPDQLKA